jgi:hypothetical protein
MSRLAAHERLKILNNYGGRHVRSLAIFCGFFLITYFAYFLYSDMFGVYSDDQYEVFKSMSGNAIDTAIYEGIYWGRPIGFLAAAILLTPLLKLGGTSMAYLGVCIVLTVEAFLVFTFFRTFLSKNLSFVLATIYLLFPADTSKFFFVHGLMTHLSSILFWTAAILYARGRQIYSSIVIISTILVYETHLAQGIMIPLIIFLLRSSTGQLNPIRQELRNAAPFFAVFLLAGSLLLLWRLGLAPGRLRELPGGDFATAERLLLSGWFGIGAVIASLADRATWISKPHSATIYVVFAIVLYLNFSLYSMWGEQVGSLSSLRISTFWSSILLICGIVLMYVSYLPFALELSRYPPIQITGRLSGVHLGSSVGYVLILASLAMLTAVLVPRQVFIVSGCTIFVSYAFLLFGFFLIYQQRLIQNWTMQTNYWNQLKQCVNQAHPKLIVIDSDDEEARMRGSELIFDWTIAYLPFVVTQNPQKSDYSPLILTLRLLETQAEVSGDKLKLRSLFTWGLFPTEAEIPLSETMIVKPLGGALVPVSSSFPLGHDSVSVGLTCHTAALGAAP